MSENKIFGLRPVAEALKAGRPFEKIMLRNSGDLPDRSILALARERNIPVNYVPQERLNQLSKNANHQGIVAFFGAVEYAVLETVLEQLSVSGKPPFLLLLDRITDVRNFGAIARTAECAGVDAIIVPAKGAAALNDDAMKTSAGALNHVAVCRVANLKSAIFAIKSYGIKVVAATEKADTLCYDADLSSPVAVIVGSEESGIAPANLSLADSVVKIPLQGNIASLNVSAATAITLFECVHQNLKRQSHVTD